MVKIPHKQNCNQLNLTNFLLKSNRCPVLHQDWWDGSPVNCINAKLRDYDNCTPVSIPILVLTVRVNHCRTIAAQDSTYTQRNSFTKYLALDRPFHYKITAAKDFKKICKNRHFTNQFMDYKQAPKGPCAI